MPYKARQGKLKNNNQSQKNSCLRQQSYLRLQLARGCLSICDLRCTTAPDAYAKGHIKGTSLAYAAAMVHLCQSWLL